jgi:hypothetical protein
LQSETEKPNSTVRALVVGRKHKQLAVTNYNFDSLKGGKRKRNEKQTNGLEKKTSTPVAINQSRDQINNLIPSTTTWRGYNNNNKK